MPRICTKCHIEKDENEFGKSKQTRSGLTTRCLQCRRLYNTQRFADKREHILKQSREWRAAHKEKVRYYNHKRNYKISEEEYNNLLKLQDNKCAICDKNFKNSKDTHVDHNHLMNSVRGLLCHKCNTALGLLNENIDNCYALIKYILKYN